MTTALRPPTVVRPGGAAAAPPAPFIPTAHTTPEEQTEIGAVSFLCCGAPGSGKTHFGAGMPEPLFFQFDSNMKTLEKFGGIPFLVPSQWTPDGETSTTKAFSERVLPLLEARRAHEIAGRPVGSLVFDTGTEMADDLALRIVGIKTNERDSQARFGEFLREAHQLFRRVADLAKPRGTLPRYNVAVLFHLADVTDEKGNRLKVAPAIMGRIKNEIQRRFDVGLLFRCRADAAASATQPGKVVVTRSFEVHTVPPDMQHEGLAFDRLGGIGGGRWKQLPAIIENPSYAKLVDLWTKGEAV